MKTKNIWLIATIFGALASTTLYLALFSSSSTEAMQTEVKSQKEVSEDVKNTMNNGSTNEPKEPLEAIPHIEISQGKRALSITVSEEQGVSGYITPGSYVDVIVMVPPPEGENASAQILLENKKVVAVGEWSNAPQQSSGTPQTEEETEEVGGEAGENVKKGPIQYRTVTLEVLPIEGSSLALSDLKGEITLMLRAPKDTTSSPHTHITLEQLNKGAIPK